MSFSFRSSFVKREGDKNSYDRLKATADVEGGAGLLVGELNYFLLQEIRTRKENSGCSLLCLSSSRVESREARRVVVHACTELTVPPGDIVSFSFPPLPPTFEGLHGAASDSSSANSDPLHWRYLLQVTLRLRATEKGCRVGLRLRGRQIIFRFPIVVCALGLSRIPASPALAIGTQARGMHEEDGVDDTKDEADMFWMNPELHPPLPCCAMVPWQTLLTEPSYASAYAKLTRSGFSATAREVRRSGSETLCRDADEDFGCRDRDSLVLRPCYLLSESRDK